MNTCGYYVYFTKVDGVVKYIGKGIGDRFMHTFSGVSHIKQLNDDYFSGKEIITYIYMDGLPDIAAKDIESQMIRQYKDQIYNKNLSLQTAIVDWGVFDLEDYTLIAGAANLDFLEFFLGCGEEYRDEDKVGIYELGYSTSYELDEQSDDDDNISVYYHGYHQVFIDQLDKYVFDIQSGNHNE